MRATGVAVAGGASNRPDAYAAVLSLDGVAPLTSTNAPTNAPIRNALLDVNNDGTFNALDIPLYLNKLLDANGQPLQNGTGDWSRYDLNGDGYTGGPTTKPFDLDRVGSTQYGTSDLTRKVTQRGLARIFDERDVTDLDVLCYCAYSELYKGTSENRETLLGDVCQPFLNEPVLRISVPGKIQTKKSGTLSDSVPGDTLGASATARFGYAEGSGNHDVVNQPQAGFGGSAEAPPGDWSGRP